MGTSAEQKSWENFREWVETTLNVWLAPDGLVATPETVDQFAQILECRAKEIAASLRQPPAAPQGAWQGIETLEWRQEVFCDGFNAGVNAVDKFGEVQEVAEEAWLGYERDHPLRARQEGPHE